MPAGLARTAIFGGDQSDPASHASVVPRRARRQENGSFRSLSPLSPLARAGAGDLPRDVRGFAVKFLYGWRATSILRVGNNIPVFVIQDADQVSPISSIR